ncbi:MAG: polyphosphate polymerase domain-containing protein [Paludibacteraceae bacterium]|nr:polyphosphate polymerase domain-containing protein [Paludibacteraceae bacterium]
MTDTEAILSQFDPISLEEMESVKLMNRIDTKYVVTIRQLPLLLNMAKRDYYAQQIGGKRLATYDTVYYDTADLDMYIRHHDRQLVRQKIRVRQYVDSDLTFLEIKRKNNKGRTKKKRISVPGFAIDGDVVGHGKRDWRVADFIAEKSRYTWEQISPKLRTSFRRITLVNKQKTERLTIDLNLVWENETTGVRMSYPDLVIVELKRDGNQPSAMIPIMQTMRITPLKISKYCIGTALTSPLLKQNRFKQKIRRLEKLLATK